MTCPVCGGDLYFSGYIGPDDDPDVVYRCVDCDGEFVLDDDDG